MTGSDSDPWVAKRERGHLGVAIRTGRGVILARESAETMLGRRATGETGVGFFVSGEGDTLRFSHGGDNEGSKLERSRPSAN
jgi:hypothetical protein